MGFIKSIKELENQTIIILTSCSGVDVLIAVVEIDKLTGASATPHLI